MFLHGVSLTPRRRMNHTERAFPATYVVNLQEKSVFWEVIVLMPVRKKAHVDRCLILTGYRAGAV